MRTNDEMDVGSIINVTSQNPPSQLSYDCCLLLKDDKQPWNLELLFYTLHITHSTTIQDRGSINILAMAIPSISCRR